MPRDLPPVLLLLPLRPPDLELPPRLGIGEGVRGWRYAGSSGMFPTSHADGLSNASNTGTSRSTLIRENMDDNATRRVK